MGVGTLRATLAQTFSEVLVIPKCNGEVETAYRVKVRMGRRRPLPCQPISENFPVTEARISRC